ncbi:GGDEF domain-containing protein [Pelomonas sp. KK5]|uniref:GGDEF domain-containing protein n=1 Tax=Pelomonas sp. KK5 TaxID=1855730 RepID=UPI00097CB32A|nr:GGDEF domain-containing protein [Pelomonas sp. KK5]
MMIKTPARLLITMALLAAAAAGQAQPLAARIQAAAELGQRQPEQALQQLGELRSNAAPTPEDLLLLDETEGRTRLENGDNAGALAVADRMADQPGHAPQADLLRALVAARQGLLKESVQFAQRALLPLEPACKAVPAAASSPAALRAEVPPGCRVRDTTEALRIMAVEQERSGALSQAVLLYERALGLAEAGHADDLAMFSSGQLAVLASEQGRHEESQVWMQRARALAGGDRLLQVHLANFESMVASRTGDKARQVRVLLDSLRLAREIDAPRMAARAQNNLANYYMHEGEPARSLAMAREALPVVLRYKDLRSERILRHNMAVALLQLRQVEAARREISRVEELRHGQADTTLRITELRELGEAWAMAGQPKEAIALFHLERQLTAEANARNREASLRQLQLKYDSKREQHDLDLLTSDRNLKDRQLANRSLAQQVGIAIGVLLALSLVLVGIMIKRVRDANKRLKASQALLRAQSERDPLTDLANRRHFLAVMEQQQQLHARFSGALLMVDIDHFKHVNDRHGHGAGDVVICEVARRLSHAVRTEDLVVRWGGEEFLIFAPDVGQEPLTQLADRILQSVGATPVEIETGALRVTVSIGFAHFPLPPALLPVHWEQAVNWADMALYVAKAQGRNQAMGIATVKADDTDALAQIEADFEAACSSERVRMTQVPGPALSATPAAGNPASPRTDVPAES